MVRRKPGQKRDKMTFENSTDSAPTLVEKRNYRCDLNFFLRYTFGSEDSSREVLIRITAMDIRRFLAYKAFGMTNPNFDVSLIGKRGVPRPQENPVL